MPQVLEVGIDAEERPAREAVIGRAFEPPHRLVEIAKDRIDARDVVVHVVGVTERLRRLERPADALEGAVPLASPGVDNTLENDDQRFVRELLRCGGYPLLRRFQIPTQEWRKRARDDGIDAPRPLAIPDVRSCL